MKNKVNIQSDKIKVGRTNFQLMNFNSRRSFERWTDARLSNLKVSGNKETYRGMIERTKDRARQRSDWYGKPIVNSFIDIAKHEKYLHFDLLARIRPKVKKSLKAFMEFESDYQIQRKKIEYNDREIGIFSFDRAAMGLRKVNKGGHQKIVSDVKKSFAYHQPKNRSEKSIKIYIIAGGNAAVEGEEMVYTGIGAVLVAQYLLDAGFDVEVNVVNGAMDRHHSVQSIVKVKKFESDLNVNDLLLMTASPRYFRFKGFKNIIANFDNVNKFIGRGLGYSTPESTIRKALVFKNKDNANAILMDRAYSEKAVISSIKKVINEAKSNSRSN